MTGDGRRAVLKLEAGCQVRKRIHSLARLLKRGGKVVAEMGTTRRVTESLGQVRGYTQYVHAVRTRSTYTQYTRGCCSTRRATD
jgi:hypothetical protein